MNPSLKRAVMETMKDRGVEPGDLGFHPLPGDGSRRVFWRITCPEGEESIIAMSNTPSDETIDRENRAYLMIGRHLRGMGAPLPEIYRHDLERGWFIMEDMGSTSLHDLVSSGEDPLPAYERVIHRLFRMQTRCGKGFDPRWCCQTERYDPEVMLRYEARYFRDAFLSGYLGLKREWPGLEAPFAHLARQASRAGSDFFLHRDFQSRNIMLRGNSVGFIDWQGGRLGPLGYDLASLLIDPYADLDRTRRERLYRLYLDLVRGRDPSWAEPFERGYPYLATQRNLQILGAFSFLTMVMNKPFFEAYIPRAVKSLHELLHLIPDREVSPLRQLVSKIRHHKKILDMEGSCS